MREQPIEVFVHLHVHLKNSSVIKKDASLTSKGGTHFLIIESMPSYIGTLKVKDADSSVVNSILTWVLCQNVGGTPNRSYEK
ncbi:hypothetical protein A3863_04645 [Priestia endophytica]|nr:hypothetical protein A3863_04645 [Priestia endophytica]